jgi:Fur family zinc uptake transcriptional regulator
MIDKTKFPDIAFRKHDHRRCQRQLLTEASQLCATRKLRLTPRRRQVLEIMLASHQPISSWLKV